MFVGRRTFNPFFDTASRAFAGSDGGSTAGAAERIVRTASGIAWNV